MLLFEEPWKSPYIFMYRSRYAGPVIDVWFPVWRHFRILWFHSLVNATIEHVETKDEADGN